MPRKFLAVLSAAVLASAAAYTQASGAKGFRPSGGEFRSPNVDITQGSVIATSGSRLGLILSILNKTDRTLWLTVRFEPPAPSLTCAETRRVDPKQEASFTCAQDTIVADADYPIAITCLADSALHDTVEANSTRMRFGKKDVKAFQEWLEAAKLPKTYENIVMKEKLGLGTAMFGALGPDNGGTVTVAPDGVEYRDKKRTIVVSAGQIRGVAVRSLGQREIDQFVVVDYDEAGAAKILAFRGSMYRGDAADLPRLLASLQALYAQRDAGK
jgi:hypothetical protein